MEPSALLVLLVLMGTVYSKPRNPSVCQYPCSPANKLYLPYFHHTSDLQHSSVAPWNLTFSHTEGREPQFIEHAVCSSCTVKDMVAKPIFIQITVYRRLQHSNSWCSCPYNLAVGCTCVREQRQ